ncbi:MAG: thioesterase [Flavobacteriaceae bacterium]|nr:MAG: thioesterase [Flavobacteriaceae bacterium]
MEVTVKKMNKFLMFKLPAAYLCGVKLKELDTTKAVVKVKFRWINQNPFNSMYFAVQSMAAELTTGAIVIKKIKECGKNISMLVTNHSGAFSKKAVGLITFTCNDGSLIDDALKRTISTGEGQTITMKSEGVNEKGEEVSAYKFEWSIKLKSSK